MPYMTDFRCEPCEVGWYGSSSLCWSCGQRSAPRQLPSPVNPYRPNPKRVGPV